MHDGRLYAAIDLHSNNNYLAILDDEDRVVFERRLKNRLENVLRALERHRERIEAVAVESTFNWYWLVDGLMDHGYEVKLVNTAAVKQYDGIKFSDDRSDAKRLAHLMRLGILPTGYIMEREFRAIRDLLRKRLQLVQQRTRNLLSLQNLKQRNEGVRLSVNDMRSLTLESIRDSEPDVNRAMSIHTTLNVIMALDIEIDKLEKALLKQMRPTPGWKPVQSIWGVGPILGMTILLETGPPDRFSSPGDYASYSRMVRSQRTSNGKLKGKGNDKCGNRYLCWAWVEAANFAIQHHAEARRFFQRKSSRSNPILARKALAHKLARAGWHVMRTGQRFDPARVFG